MKKIFPIFLIAAISLSYAFIYKSDNPASNSIVLKFVTRNGYGNNLYIDNVTAGQQFSRDIKITSFINLPSDTIYSVGPVGMTIDTIKAVITNVGKNSIPSAKFILEIPELFYKDTVTLPNIAPKSFNTVSFDSVVFPLNNTYNAKLYLADTIDGNPYNDTLKQSFGFYRGQYRNVLFEEFTSMTSPSAAANNPSLNNFVNSKFDSVTAINYHLGFPAPGNDSIYLVDTTQNNERRDYYNIVSVPTLIFNGSYISGLPFSTSNIQTSFDTLKKIGSPLVISVVDTRLPGDTISSNISIQIISPVRAGNYFLRVNAIERKKTYSTAPGSNGETVFYDIFRDAIPGTQGIPISTAIGVYNYNFKYVRDVSWADSMLYTVAYVQNDDNFEVLNSAKSRSGVYDRLKNFQISETGKNYDRKIISKNKNEEIFSRGSRSFSFLSAHDTSSSNFYLEQFESPGLPQNWTLAHLSELITFENVYNSGINGPSYPGNGCLRMNFYANPDTTQRDTLYSDMVIGVTSADTLKFDYAYAGYLYNEGDSLAVYISTDGGLTFPRNIFYKGGLGLATTSSTTISFVPTIASQWRTFAIPLAGILPDNFTPQIAKEYKLYQNYPNPFNPVTKIAFTLPVQSNAQLVIYDMTGREVAKLLDEQVSAGSHEINFNGDFLSSGIYFYKLITPGFTQSKKMVLIK
ncbi:MAG: T9SS type A sorting domain-containing protein [Ignavibacteria bacterium]|nr:T9SS type A sorting domain-containing protein [Ignavibacteria bacterium]